MAHHRQPSRCCSTHNGKWYTYSHISDQIRLSSETLNRFFAGNNKDNNMKTLNVVHKRRPATTTVTIKGFAKQTGQRIQPPPVRNSYPSSWRRSHHFSGPSNRLVLLLVLHAKGGGSGAGREGIGGGGRGWQGGRTSRRLPSNVKSTRTRTRSKKKSPSWSGSWKQQKDDL